jgi:hypothetical protein
MAELPTHPSRIDEDYVPPPPPDAITYAKGRNIALGVYVLPSILTAPILFLFSVDPTSVEGEGVFLLICAFVVAAVVHGGVAIGLLTSAANRRKRGDSVGADGMVHGWIYGIAANIIFFQVYVLAFRAIAIYIHHIR